MDNQPNLDFNADKSDTLGNNDNPDDKNIVIRLDELEPLNDKDCDHKFVRDDDEIGDYRAWSCVKCHRGVFLPKQVTRVT